MTRWRRSSVLLRELHDAAVASTSTAADRWSDEMADPAAATIVCHNDVCLENVVFRDGVPSRSSTSTSRRPGARSTTSPHSPGCACRSTTSHAPASDGTRPTSRSGCASSPTRTGSNPTERRTCSTRSTTPWRAAASSCVAASPPATRTSRQCGSRAAARPASTAAGVVGGGPPDVRGCAAPLNPSGAQSTANQPRPGS